MDFDENHAKNGRLSSKNHGNRLFILNKKKIENMCVYAIIQNKEKRVVYMI